MHGSVWEVIFSSQDIEKSVLAHFTSQLDAIIISAQTATASAEKALATAARAQTKAEDISTELDVEMSTVATGFATLGAFLLPLPQVKVVIFLW